MMETSPIHPQLAAGRWHELSLAEQMGKERAALDRALELMDLTLSDPKHRLRLRELCRSREVLCDYFFGDNTHRSTPDSLEAYFTVFAVMARALR